MDLDLSSLAGAKKIVTCTIKGIVEQEDISRLLAARTMPTAKGRDAGDLSKLREKHHSVARLMASGLQQSVVATICGYTQSYLSILLNNPSMEELISYYRANYNNAAEVVTERLRSIGLKAIEELDTRLEDGDMETSELLGLAKLGLDRGGHGPKSTVHNVNEHHIFNEAELQRLNREARKGSSEHIIDLTPALPAPEKPE